MVYNMFFNISTVMKILGLEEIVIHGIDSAYSTENNLFPQSFHKRCGRVNANFISD